MTINNINDLSSYLASQVANTKDTPYLIALKIDSEADFETLKKVLNGAADKYVYLDLSGSTITTIPKNAFVKFFTTPTFNGNFITTDTGCNTLTGITIPDNVIAIEDVAFAFCINLENVTIPNCTINIKNNAFQGCSNLKKIVIPDDVIGIGNFTFAGCTSLVRITIPDNVTTVGNWAFEDCTSLESVIMGKSVTSIGNRAYAGCRSLKNITIPDSVTSIGYGVFLGCYNLTSVTFEGKIPLSGFCNNTDWSSFPGDLRDKFYATDPVNGTPGTYITTAPVKQKSVWVKQ
jgi:hypothetical protein